MHKNNKTQGYLAAYMVSFARRDVEQKANLQPRIKLPVCEAKLARITNTACEENPQHEVIQRTEMKQDAKLTLNFHRSLKTRG